jgi:Flp pilus assembly protein TadG
MTQLRSYMSADHGQSLVEIALTLPLLLITLLGMVDAGRAYVYTTAVTNAAREGAYYYAKTSGATIQNVALHACNETGFTDYQSAFSGTVTDTSHATCTGGIAVSTGTCTVGSSGGYTVNVSYTFSLISGYLFQSLLGRDSLVAENTMCLRSLQ